ncbi:hypothetical protein GCM10022243_44640 [Saccharothrix violaceirubra]
MSERITRASQRVNCRRINNAPANTKKTSTTNVEVVPLVELVRATSTAPTSTIPQSARMT